MSSCPKCNFEISKIKAVFKLNKSNKMSCPACKVNLRRQNNKSAEQTKFLVGITLLAILIIVTLIFGFELGILSLITIIIFSAINYASFELEFDE